VNEGHHRTGAPHPLVIERSIDVLCHMTLLSSLPGLTRQSITLIKKFFSDGCPGQARA
jgi:hypothetical protein